MAAVTLDKITKIYPNGFQAVTDLSLELEDGEFLVLVGPSGCGKSTALRMIAGLEDISGGDLSVGDRRVNDVEPKDRDIAMVFQNYALYPQMTVAENIGFPLKLRKVAKADRDAQVREAAKILELTEQLDKKTSHLVRWSTSACCDGSSNRATPFALPDGRTVVEPRRQAPRPDAGGHRCDPA